MTDDVVIKAEGVSKKFCLDLKKSLLYGTHDVFRNMMGLPYDAGTLRKSEFWALDDVSFEMKRGETLGIIGVNGSGKSTLLRLLSGIFPPDKGKITVKGRIGSLIAVGAGFHPHMTGRENIFLNGTILGMTKKDILQKFDSIVDFAEIGEFLEAPVSTYSSGMRVRLGFAVAINTNPEVLLLDEILSVGDLSFQNKSLRKLAEMREKANAVIFVSHNLEHVRNMCSKTLIINKGIPVFHGDTEEAIFRYHEISREIRLESLKKENSAVKDVGHISTGDIEFLTAGILDQDGKETEGLEIGEDIRLSFVFEAKKNIGQPSFSIGILNERNEICIWQMSKDNNIRFHSVEAGHYSLHVCFRNPKLVPGVYRLTFALRDSFSGETFERIVGKNFCFIINGERIPRGIVDCKSDWELIKR